ncbi:hypothetical protein COO60DRAFT_1635403 [Scenedesmus sp. NREL 46B-D3]|nr:hypothetical protein COO60DRAFT_1635403 [Scenedesmus sp. NREL 46B-D3]
MSDDSAAAALPLHFVNAGKSLFGESLAACMADGSWHSTGATLGFALEHCYAASSIARLPVELEPDMLKGSDLLLYQTLKNAGLSPKLASLLRTGQGFDAREQHGPPEDEEEETEEEEEEVQQQQEMGEEQQQHSSSEEEEDNEESKLLLGAAFGGPQRLGEQEMDSDDLAGEEDCKEERELLAVTHGASRLPSNMVWAKPPSTKHWMYKDRVSAWGNSCYTAVWYVAAVLVVQVPACGEGCRAHK